MDQPDPNPAAKRIGKGIALGERFLYTTLAAFLALAALILLIGTAIHLVGHLAGEADIPDAVLRALEDLLLVVMLVEIMHTVGISLQRNRLVCEPFLIVGIIAAVRRMLVVTAEQVNPSEAERVSFEMAMLELGVLTGIILALVVGIAVLRKFAVEPAEKLGDERNSANANA